MKLCIYDPQNESYNSEATKLEDEEGIAIADFLALCLTRKPELDVVAVTVRRTAKTVECLWTRNQSSENGDDSIQADQLRLAISRLLNCGARLTEAEFRRLLLRNIFEWTHEKIMSRIKVLFRPRVKVAGADTDRKTQNLWSVSKAKGIFEDVKEQIMEGQESHLFGYVEKLHRRAEQLRAEIRAKKLRSKSAKIKESRLDRALADLRHRRRHDSRTTLSNAIHAAIPNPIVPTAVDLGIIRDTIEQDRTVHLVDSESPILSVSSRNNAQPPPLLCYADRVAESRNQSGDDDETEYVYKPDEPNEANEPDESEYEPDEPDEHSMFEEGLRLIRGDLAILEYARSQSSSLFVAIFTMLLSLSDAIKSLETSLYSRTPDPNFLKLLDVVVCTADNLGNSNVFKRILENYDPGYRFPSLPAFVRSLRLVGIYRFGCRRLYEAFHCRGADNLESITVEFVDCPDEGTVDCLENMLDFVENEARLVFGKPDLIIAEEKILNLGLRKYRPHPHVSLHAELRLALELRRRGITRALIGVSKGCCSLCTHAMSTLNRMGFQYFVNGSHEKPYLGRLTGVNEIDTEVKSLIERDFKAWLRKIVVFPDSDVEIADKSDDEDDVLDPDVKDYIASRKLPLGWDVLNLVSRDKVFDGERKKKRISVGAITPAVETCDPVWQRAAVKEKKRHSLGHGDIHSIGMDCGGVWQERVEESDKKI